MCVSGNALFPVSHLGVIIKCKLNKIGVPSLKAFMFAEQLCCIAK